jgi:hypothetical protein
VLTRPGEPEVRSLYDKQKRDQSRPVAVFLDGFKFHADEASGHNRVARDVQQRQALVHSGHFWVWNFSWEDIQFRNDPVKIPATLTGETHAQRRNDMARQLLTCDELSLAQSAGSYTSWSPARAEAFVHGSQQYMCQENRCIRADWDASRLPFLTRLNQLVDSASKVWLALDFQTRFGFGFPLNRPVKRMSVDRWA